MAPQERLSVTPQNYRGWVAPAEVMLEIFLILPLFSEASPFSHLSLVASPKIPSYLNGNHSTSCLDFHVANADGF